MTITPATNAMILASAGTGKTFELSNRYIRLLVDGVHPQSILATTFTRKAAGEILDRIVLRLARATTDPATARETATALDRPDTTAERFAEILQHLLANLNCLQVETLDAFFARIARTFSLDIGMPPGWQIADPGQIEAIRNQAIRRSLTQRSALNIVHDLAKGEAKRGISGMVRQTVSDLYRIYRETLDQDSLEAWSRLQPVPLLTDEQIDGLWQQLHEVDVQGTEHFKKKYLNDLDKISRRDWPDLLKTGISSKVARNERVFNRGEIQPEIFEPMRQVVEHALALNLNLLVRQTRGAVQFLQGFHKEFLSLKVANAVLEFDDVAYLAWRLFRRYSFRRLAWRMDQNIDHLLLDEFQDTSVQQWQVLQPLAERVCIAGGNRSFFCVGDIKQAIYGWRGGVSEIFEEVRDGFSATLDEVSSRNLSYRSSPVVIEAVNRIFGNMAGHRKLEDRRPLYQSWLDSFEPHETVWTDLPGYVCFENTSDKERHVAEAARRIGQLAEQHPEKSIGVLVRTNDAIAKLIFALGQAGVVASEEGGNPLTDSAAVNIILAALRLIDHPDDPVSRYHLLPTPLAEPFGLTGENFAKPAHPCRAAAQTLRYRLIHHGYGDLISGWARLLEPSCTQREWFRLGQLIEKGYSVSVADHLRTADFVSWIERTRVPDPSAAKVRVMTIHKSKGLEFDLVVLPELDFDRGKSPRYVVGRDSPTKPVKLVCHFMDEVKREWLPEEFQTAFDETLERQIHELLCTIYVAVTRARHALHLIASPEFHPGRRNAAGLIMAGLQIDYDPKKDTPGQVLWDDGDPNWNLKTPPDSDDNASDPPLPDTPPAPGPIRFAARKTSRNLPWESPSSREGDERVRLGRLLQLEDNRDARLEGSLIHACFGRVGWLEDGVPDDASLVQTLRLIEGADAEQIGSAISAFRKMLQRPTTARLLGREQFATDLFHNQDETRVENERPFAVRWNAQVISGFIDRLVLLQRDGKVVAADVVDFKTDSLEPGDPAALQQRTDIYRPQISGYRDAVAAIYHLDPEAVSARLLFVAIDHQVPVA